MGSSTVDAIAIPGANLSLEIIWRSCSYTTSIKTGPTQNGSSTSVLVSRLSECRKLKPFTKAAVAIGRRPVHRQDGSPYRERLILFRVVRHLPRAGSMQRAALVTGCTQIRSGTPSRCSAERQLAARALGGRFAQDSARRKAKGTPWPMTSSSATPPKTRPLPMACARSWRAMD